MLARDTDICLIFVFFVCDFLYTFHILNNEQKK